MDNVHPFGSNAENPFGSIWGNPLLVDDYGIILFATETLWVNIIS